MHFSARKIYELGQLRGERSCQNDLFFWFCFPKVMFNVVQIVYYHFRDSANDDRQAIKKVLKHSTLTIKTTESRVFFPETAD